MAKAPAKTAKKKVVKKKEKRIVHNGIVHIQATFNNTIITIADLLVRIGTGPIAQALRPCPTDSINVSKANLSSLFRRKIDARNTCHIFSFNPAAACVSD